MDEVPEYMDGVELVEREGVRFGPRVLVATRHFAAGDLVLREHKLGKTAFTGYIHPRDVFSAPCALDEEDMRRFWSLPHLKPGERAMHSKCQEALDVLRRDAARYTAELASKAVTGVTEEMVYAVLSVYYLNQTILASTLQRARS